MKGILKRYRFLILAIVLACVGLGIYFYTRQPSVVPTGEEAAREEALGVKTMLSKHLVLPEGEEPDIRKINQKLDDPFFVNAEIGDYLIIFYKSRIAYIYSPTQDKITNAGVVFVNPQQATSTKR